MLKYECYILELKCKEGPQTLCKILYQHLAINVLKIFNILYKEAVSRPNWARILTFYIFKHVPK